MSTNGSISNDEAVQDRVPGAAPVGPAPRRHRRHPRRRWPLVAVALFAGFAVVCHAGRRAVVANATSSVDPGLYLAWPGEPAVGRLVSFRVPRPIRPYFADRAGRPVEDAADWYLIKPILAGPGDRVDATGPRLLVNGVDCGPIYARDDAGRELPRWREARTLEEDEWLTVSRRCPGSLDGRYYGPIRGGDVECVRRPIIRWAGDGGSSGWRNVGRGRWWGTYVDEPWRAGEAGPCPQTNVQ